MARPKGWGHIASKENMEELKEAFARATERARDEIGLYSCSDVAEVMGMTPRAIQKKMARGEIKARKIGGRWTTTKADLQEYINHISGIDGRG